MDSEPTFFLAASRMTSRASTLALTSGFSQADLPTCPPRAWPGISIRRYTSETASRHHQRPCTGTGILTGCPSTTPFGLVLGSDSPWADLPSPGNLRLSATVLPTPFIATHVRIFTSTSSSGPHGPPSTYRGTLPYPRGRSLPPARRGFGLTLSPDHFRRGIARPVSYYALFK
jgi:hypothetical protein